MAQQNLDIVVRVRGGQVAATEVSQVGKAVSGVGSATETTNKKTAGLSSTLKGLASGIAVYKGYQFIKGAINTTTQLAKNTAALSRVTGMDAKSAGAWVGVAEERGIQTKALNQGFISLSKNITGVSQGNKAAITAFQQLGIGTAGLAQAKPADVLNAISDSFQKMPNGAQKAALAQKLFGRQAQSLLPLINQGSGALNNQMDAMGKHLGLTDESVKQSMELVKAQRELNASMMGVKVAIAQALLPILVALSAVILPIIQGFAQLMQHSGLFRAAVIAVTGALVAYVAIVNLARLANIGFMVTAAPWVALAVAIGLALVLLYQKCSWFRNAVNGAFAGVVAAFKWVKQAAVDVFNWVKSNWPLLASILGGPIAAAAIQIAKHWSDITKAAQSVWNFLKGLGSFIGGAFSSAWSAAASVIKSVASAISSVIDAAKTVASLPGKAGSLIGKGLSAAGGLVGLQGGGTVTSGGLAVVGERGPEVVALPVGASVIPNHAIGGVGPTQIVVPLYLENRQVGMAVAQWSADVQAAR